MQSKEFDRWARIRAQGALRYVLLNGVLFYGLPMFLIMTYVIPHPRLTVAQSALLWVAIAAPASAPPCGWCRSVAFAR